MAASAETFHLAALLRSVGRAEARQRTAAAGSATAAFAALDQPREFPERLARQCAAHGIEVLTPADPAFPGLLRVIPDPPPLLYAMGQPGVLERPTVGIIGARRCTSLGVEVAGMFGGELAARGVAVVSGLARGIDAAAHRAAAARGVTVAVLGSGLVSAYPAANRGLLAVILARGGLLLSEYPPFASARRHYFPERNRLISGVSLGVVVVEAGERSGSLITARMALEQGREVFAVPGPVTSAVSRGCHRLLRDGAALAECAADVVTGLNLDGDGIAPICCAPGGFTAGAPDGGDPLQSRILAAVGGVVTPVDQVIADSGVPGDRVAATLVELELAGFVRQVPGGYIRRPSR